ncbi:extracellular solute-binding protein [Jiangella endophytica]|uniref:extracellular solute-binding protein n=1 Tax=Jiangella endophytica TaxID=1623398 RepID=UPI0013002495|nr:extracellular solute-binding protein [Jiangella endophytica]
MELPTYQPGAGPVPDLTSKHARGSGAFLTYPSDRKWVYSKPPLNGDLVRVQTYTSDPVAPPLEKNVMWQAINEAAGGEIDVLYTPSADYPQRFATLIAGGDLPDMVSIQVNSVQQLPSLLKAKFSDLSEHLSGDAVTKYPSLAGLPAEAWQSAMVDGRIWGVPITRSPLGNTLYIRADLLAARGLPEQPKDFDEFRAVLIGMTDERARRWAVAEPTAMLAFLASTYGVAVPWHSIDGKLVHSIETPQYQEALADGRALVEAGVFHPDGVGSSNNQRNDWFTSGTVAMTLAGYSGWSKYPMWGEGIPGYRMGGMAPFGRNAGIQPDIIGGQVAGTITAIAKGSPVEKILPLLDWLATPFGTNEYLLRQYGIEGTTFSWQGTEPVLNSVGENQRLVPFWSISSGPWVLYNPGKPDVTRAQFDYQEQAIGLLKDNPTTGLYSETQVAKGAQLTKLITDGVGEVLLGRRPVSAWPEIVENWKNRGGNAARDEYQEAMANG